MEARDPFYLRHWIPEFVAGMLVGALLVLAFDSDPEKTHTITVETQILPVHDTIDVPYTRFVELRGRDTILATDTVYKLAGIECGSFNFYGIQPAAGRPGFDTVEGVSDCYGKRATITLRPAPLYVTSYDTVIRTTEVISEKLVEKHAPLLALSAHGFYDPLHQNYGGGVEGSLRLSNLQLYARPELSFQEFSARLGARFIIWEGP